MHHIKGLTIKIPGRYNDAFLYSSKLYLIDDKHLYIIDFDKFISNIIPDDPELKVLCKYAFLNNDFFYKADNDFYDFFQIPTIKKFLMTGYDKIRNIKFTKTKLKDFTICKITHNHRGAYHLEIYKNNIFISSDHGVFSYRLINNKLYRESQLLEYPAYQISANFGNFIYFSCAENGLNILYFDDLTSGRRLKSDLDKKLKNRSISIDFAYTDLLVRDVSNKFHYQYDRLLNSEIDRKEFIPKEKINSFEEKKGKLIKNAKLISCNTNRLVKILPDSIELYKMNYDDRKESNKNLDDYYEQIGKWEIHEKIEDFYDGFQTVFGYVMDTDIGTFIIDDDIHNPKKTDAFLINYSENVKLRHFYRSINYSHLLLSIKNNHFEIYSDLSDYFFPKDKKQIRRHITRRQAIK